VEERRAVRRVEEDLRWGRGDMAGYSKACGIFSAGHAVSARQGMEAVSARLCPALRDAPCSANPEAARHCGGRLGGPLTCEKEPGTGKVG
jgi:hypothetical protein